MDLPESAGTPERNVLRHAPRETEWEPAAEADPEALGAIDRHIERHFGPIEFVWHELVSDLVHVDIHVVNPSPARPHYTLVTSGMSARPMAVPQGYGISPYAELMIGLPADWKLTQQAFQDERWYWPIRLLKVIARLPHEYDTWIGQWHSVPNGDPAMPYAPDTPFAGVLIAPMLRCEPEARVIDTDSGKQISLLALVPLHGAEMRLKVEQGTDALLDAFSGMPVSEFFDPSRPSYV